MLKNKLKNTLKNKKGFTLAELLIVVAIIAILVAISVPIFGNKLETAKEATDKANERAAKAAAVSKYLDDQLSGFYYYDADKGKVVGSDEADSIVVYGKSSNYPSDTAAKDKLIRVEITEAGEVKIDWITKAQISK